MLALFRDAVERIEVEDVALYFHVENDEDKPRKDERNDHEGVALQVAVGNEDDARRDNEDGKHGDDAAHVARFEDAEHIIKDEREQHYDEGVDRPEIRKSGLYVVEKFLHGYSVPFSFAWTLFIILHEKAKKEKHFPHLSGHICIFPVK